VREVPIRGTRNAGDAPRPTFVGASRVVQRRGEDVVQRRGEDMATARYEVRGMTCGHCVNAVSTEISAIPGVTGVTVDLESGQVTVHSTEPLDPAAVRAAVDEAGYELVTA